MNLPLVPSRFSANRYVRVPNELVIVMTPLLSAPTWYVPLTGMAEDGPVVSFTSSLPEVRFPFPSAMTEPAA